MRTALFLMMATSVALTTPLFAQKTVENPITPKKVYTLRFIEELRFGDDQDEQYFWSGANTSVAADHRGHMYVGDAKGKRLLEYDAQGKFVAVVGGSGSGPGEFLGAPYIHFFSDRSAVAVDVVQGALPRFNYYDAGMAFREMVETRAGQNVPNHPLFSPDGRWIGGYFFKTKPDGGRLLRSGVLDRDWQMVKLVYEKERPATNSANAGKPEFWEDYIAQVVGDSYKGVGAVAFDSRGNIYTGITHTYELTRYDADAKSKNLVIRKQYKPIPITEEDVDGIIDQLMEPIMQNPRLSKIITPTLVRRGVEKSGMPPAKLPFEIMLTTGDDHLLVVYDVNLISGLQKAHVFSPEGTYLGDTEVGGHGFYDSILGNVRMTFRGDKAYTIHMNEDGDIQVVRYRTELAAR